MAGGKKNKKKVSDKRKALQASFTYICENTTNIASICRHLIERDVLSFDEYQEIEHFPTDTKKVMELIRVFMRKEPAFFAIFDEVLVKTGNKHVVSKIQENAGKINASNNAARNNAPGQPQEEEEESEDERDGTIDENTPDIEDLLNFLDKTREKMNLMKYFPQTLFSITRFNTNASMGSALPTEPEYQMGMQRFRTNRAIFLKQVGFFGPATIPLTSYEVSISIQHWSISNSAEVISSASDVIEVAKDHLMYIEFEDAIPIRPHIWHCLHFSIRGQEKMAVCLEERKSTKFVYMDYRTDTYDSLRFEFDMSEKNSSGQMPELRFYRAKERIESSFFATQKAEQEDPALEGARTKGKGARTKELASTQPVDSSCGCSIA